MDFFAILLPGVVLTFLLSPWSSAVFGPMLPRLNSEAEQWIAFAICSYFFGHLLHQLGSLLDNIYDTHYVGKKRRFGEENLLKETRQLVKAELGEKSEGLSMFSWAGSYVRAHNSAAGAELERAGADSKFFRSLCLLAIFAIGLFVLQGELLAALVSWGLAVFSFKRFCKQRWETSQRTYEYFVQLKNEGRTTAAMPKPAGTNSAE